MRVVAARLGARPPQDRRILTFKVQHGIAPEYLGPVIRVADLPGRQFLLSACTNRMVVPPFKLSTISTRALPVACPHNWNCLPADITLAPSLANFRQTPKTHISDYHFVLLYSLYLFSLVDLAVTFHI